MTCIHRLNLVFLALMLVVPTVLAGDIGEVQTQALHAPTEGSTTGELVALFIDHFVEGDPLPDPTLQLHSVHATVVSHHAAQKVGGIDLGTTKRTLHEGTAAVEGVRAKPGLHLWATPLDDGAVHASIQHSACTTFTAPDSRSVTRTPAVDQNRGDLEVDTSHGVDIRSCTTTDLILQGNLSIVLWAWDVDLNGHRVTSGINDTVPGTGSGPADELVIEAHEATLAIPLTPDTYALYLAQPHLATASLRITRAEGTLPGVLEPASGEDVEIQGDYAATVAAQGARQPLAASIAGRTHTATANGVPLTIPTPTPTTDATGTMALVILGLVLAGLASGWFVWPRIQRRRVHPKQDAKEDAEAHPRPAARAASGAGDAEAEACVVAAVAADGGIVVRELLASVGVSKDRAYRALDALVAKGSIVPFEEAGRKHLFTPSPGLEHRWRKIVLLRESRTRRLFSWIAVNPYAGWAEVLSITARWGWPESTTRSRLRRLVDADLVVRHGTARRGTFSTRDAEVGTLSA